MIKPIKSFQKSFQNGDTLVEVLICILIVSVILTGAYVTTTKSSQGVRNSQEHAEALKLIQGQLEQVRQDASKGAAASKVFTSVPLPFCFFNGVTYSATVGSNECLQNSSGQKATGQPVYKLEINRTNCAGIGPDCQLFTAKATWDSVTGTTVSSTEQISYRVYK